MIRFANMSAFYLMLGLPLLTLFFWSVERRKRELLRRFGDVELIQRLTASRSKAMLAVRRVFFLFGYALLVVALARPQLGTKLEEVKREGIDLIVAIDVSTSMLAGDVAPNRMDKARHELKTLIEKLRGDRIGIVAFAGDAFLVSPLTTDYTASLMILDAVDVGVIPEQGTAIARAIEIARKGFVSKDNRQKVILLLTDGEDHEGDPVAAAEAERVVLVTFPVAETETLIGEGQVAERGDAGPVQVPELLVVLGLLDAQQSPAATLHDPGGWIGQPGAQIARGTRRVDEESTARVRQGETGDENQ